jgi:Tfp pilus assembly protein PilN
MRKNSMRELRHSIVLFIIGLATFCVLVGAYVFLFLDLRTRNQAVLTMHQGLLDKEAQQKERLELERTIVTTNADRQTLESTRADCATHSQCQ